jgi:plasmid maintenance system killer protein
MISSFRNDQWRVCFVWTANAVGGGQAANVEIVDYH